MKRIISIAVSAIFVTSLFAGKGLVVNQKYFDANAKGATVNVTWYVTETQCKMKMEYRDAKVNTVNWFIPNAEGHNLLTYTEGAVPSGVQKAFYTIPVESIKTDLNVSRITVNRTGETKSVSGMLCEKIIIKTNRATTEMWVTKDFKSDFYKFYPYFQNSYELLGLNEENIQGFPLSSVTKDNSGKVISSSELISSIATNLAESDFNVPSEYKNIAEMSKGKN